MMDKNPLLNRLLKCLPALLLALTACVHAASPQEVLKAALTEWVAAQNGVSTDIVEMAPLDPRIPVQPCASNFSFDYPFVSRESVRVRCTRPNWQLFVKVGFAVSSPPVIKKASPTSIPASSGESRQVVVASVNLSAGQLLQPELLKFEKLDAEKISRTHYLEMSGLVGQEVVRAVRAGEALRSSDLRPGLMIKKGDQVMMTIGSPSTFQISVKLEALQDGHLGEQIKLRNADSERTLNGVVTGKGTVRGI